MKEKFPSLNSLVKKVILNDIIINIVSGVASLFILLIAGMLDGNVVFKFLSYGLVIIFPFYIWHLVRIRIRLSSLYLKYDDYKHGEMQNVINKLRNLIFFPYKTSFMLAIIWIIGVLYSTVFILNMTKTSVYTSIFSIFLLMGVIPFIWVVEYIIVKRTVLKLIKRYIEVLPEDYYSEIKGKGSSIVQNWTYAISYLLFYTVFFMVALNFGLYKKVMIKNYKEMGNSTINNITGDVNSLLFTDLSREEMSKYLNSISLIGDAKISVKIDKSKEILGSGIVDKKIEEDILISRYNTEKGYTIYYYMPATYLNSYNNYLKKSVFFFVFMELVILLIVIFQVGKEFKNEVKMVLESTNKIAGGDLSRGEILYSRTELGDLYGAILTVKNNTKSVITKISNYSKNVSEVIQGVQDASDFLMRVSAHQDEMVNEAIESINYIDDFTEKLKKSTETLANESEAGSTTVTQFAVTIGQVKESMHKLLRMAGSGSSAILEMNSSISEISNNLSSLKEFGFEMDNALVSLKEISEDNKLLMQELQLLTDKAIEKNSLSADGISKILEIVSMSQDFYNSLLEKNNLNAHGISEISAIVDVVDDYLDQTDVLALNAAIIAAQTDMKDRGIGVIADEIKEISEQIYKATGKITSITNTALSKIKDQEELSKQARQKISSMKGQVEMNFNNTTNLGGILVEGKENITKALVRIKEQDSLTINLAEKYKLFINQITSIYGAIEEQQKNSNELAEMSTEMKDLAEVVSNATREQTSGANQIASSSERINEFANNTRESVGKLKESLQKVLYLTSELNTNTLLSNSRSKELNNIVETVSSEMKHLKEEIRRFQI